MAKAYARYWPAAGPKKAYTILPSFQTLPAGPQIFAGGLVGSSITMSSDRREEFPRHGRHGGRLTTGPGRSCRETA